MPLNYAREFQEAYERNRNDVVRKAMLGDLDEKINNFCELHGFEKDYVIQEIQRNPIVAAQFAINPNKQNFYEKTAANFIKNISNVTEFEMLPNSALSVVRGAVMSKNKLSRSGGSSSAKTIDFKWAYGGNTFYASHKYTKQEGGSQGSQYKDLQAFIEEARPTTLRKTYFIAIADGEFYDRQNGQAGKTRIKRLRELAGSQKVFACKIDGLEALMKEIIVLDPQ